MSDRARFRLLWKTLDRRRRWEIRRLAWLGRRAEDPETAWFVMMLAGEGVRWLGIVVVVALGWIALGVVTLVLIDRNRVDPPLAVAVAIEQIVGGILMLGLFVMHGRARRLNRSIAMAPGRG